MNRRNGMLVSTLALAALVAAGAAMAQEAFPSRPLRMIVGYAPGGGTDIFARVLAERLARPLGQPVVVENRAGANGNIAAGQVARAAPDGYQLLFVVNSHVTAADTAAELPYDPIRDFSPVALAVSTPLLLVANAQFAPSTVRELIAQAKAAPGRTTFGSPGQGSPAHLAIEMLKSMAGVDIQVVHYKGAGPAQADVIAGHVNLQMPTFAQGFPPVKAGKLKLLGQTASTRSGLAPDVPTVAEAGLPGFGAEIWFALLAPSATPGPVIAKLNGAMNDVLAAPENVMRLRELGGDPIGGTPERALAVMREDQAKWRKVIRDIGLKPN